MSVPQIVQRWPPNGPQQPEGSPARVTDDTQMALAVAEALRQAAMDDEPYRRETLHKPLREAFINWLDSPDNNRAPGNTCLRSCQRLADGFPWYEATDSQSKGCGANMRVQPVGLLPIGENGLTEATRAAIAQFQAALTHAHPTALAAADLTARAIADLAAGGQPNELPGRLRAYCETQRTVWHADWLDPLFDYASRAVAETPESYIARGWDECLAILDRLDAALIQPDRDVDPCQATGLGWVAEEAFGTGLLCFLLYLDDPVAALRRAVVTAGDSDSIACLTGAFAGACHGLNAWPTDWLNRIEYRDELTAFGLLWDR